MDFKEIFGSYNKLVFNVALHYVQNTEDAEEITQDVFMKIHKKLFSFQHNSTIKTWIYRITINQSLDFIKAQKAKKRGFLSSLFSINSKIDVPDFNHPGVEMEQKEALENIFTAINQLPDNQKTVLILLKIEQNTQEQTALIMEISTKAVESLFQRAKKNLIILLNQRK